MRLKCPLNHRDQEWWPQKDDRSSKTQTGWLPRLALHHVKRVPLCLWFSRCEKRAQCPQIGERVPEGPLRDHWGNLQSLTLRIYNVSNHQAIPDGFCLLCLNKIRGKRAWQRKTNIIWYNLYVESKKNDTNELIYKNRNRLTDIGNKCMVTKAEGEEG